MQEVGAFEAKAVARLVPPQRAFNRDQAGAAIKRTRKRAENAEARALRVGRMEILPGRRPAVSLVIDSSAALAWIYAEETTDAVRRVFDIVAESGALVPALWGLEGGTARSWSCSEPSIARGLT